MISKTLYRLIFLLCLITAISLTTSACSKKTGCPVNENAQAETNKDGSFKVKKSHSGLFPGQKKKKN